MKYLILGLELNRNASKILPRSASKKKHTQKIFQKNLILILELNRNGSKILPRSASKKKATENDDLQKMLHEMSNFGFGA